MRLNPTPSPHNESIYPAYPPRHGSSTTCCRAVGRAWWTYSSPGPHAPPAYTDAPSWPPGSCPPPITPPTQGLHDPWLRHLASRPDGEKTRICMVSFKTKDDSKHWSLNHINQQEWCWRERPCFGTPSHSPPGSPSMHPSLNISSLVHTLISFFTENKFSFYDNI